MTSTPEVTEPHESATDMAKGTEQIISSILDIHIGDSCSTIHSGSIPNVTGSESDVDLLSMAIQMTGIDDLESLEADVDPESIQRQTVTEESVQRQTVTEDSLFSSYSNRNIAENIMWGGHDQEQIAARYGLQTGKRADSSANASVRNPHVFNPMKAKVNIPGLCLRQLQWEIQEAGFERTAGVQKMVLEEIQKKCSGSIWWIKADGFDVKEGLLESLKQKWSGDTDVEPEKLQTYIRDTCLEERQARLLG